MKTASALVTTPQLPVKAVPGMRLDWVPADAFTTDIAYDRPPVQRRINILAKAWVDRAMGAVYASYRSEEDRYYLIDGQHRIGALKLLGRKTELVPTVVYDDLTQAQEAEFFVRMNQNRRALSQSELFNASIIEGKQSAIEIQEVLSSLGLELSSHGDGAKVIKCVHAINRTYNAMGAAGVDATLSFILTTWGEPFPRRAFHQAMVIAVAKILFYGENQVDIDRFRTRAATSTPDEILAKAESIRGIQGGETSRLVLEQLLSLYNYHLTKGALDSRSMQSRPDPFMTAGHFKRKAGE